MAPFGTAINVKPVPFNSQLLPLPKDLSEEDTALYTGMVDPEWTIGSVANGGYVLALILEACIQFQSTKSHVDPLHVTAHFLRTTLTSSFTVCVRTVKTSPGFTNLSAELIQDGVVKITTHLIFGIIGRHPKDKVNLTLNPPSTYARRVPLYAHPSKAITKPMDRRWTFRPHVTWTDEPNIHTKNQPNGENRTSSSTVGGGGLEWGAWLEFKDTNEIITNPSLCFLVDMCLNSPSLLPKSERPGLTTSWFPTMVLSVEFKNKIPPPSVKYAARTVGIYSLGRFITPPQGRHDAYVEVWTAPSGIREGEEVDGWRDDQFCLAIATQMALTLPMEVNEKKGNSKL
ncbi:hypothetical protein CVT25_004336 [Psilocybe cyanescens]|uniref:Acyl-CoA thioesterase-like N-terminal HotDog domain-containing protein n=1 Tax=Psilocybe cyanescens TaxID=93625 RepID=A0A409XQ28_PSICY|nr:hypothetical protein CVT25_004336 [Psilocybe cyanescens]